MEGESGGQEKSNTGTVGWQFGHRAVNLTPAAGIEISPLPTTGFGSMLPLVATVMSTTNSTFLKRSLDYQTIR